MIPSIRTGEESGVIVLDVDVRPDGSGFDTLDEMGITTHPAGPTAHTPRGGCAVLLRHPGHFVKTAAGALGPYLDIRGDDGSVLLPPGLGRWWDPHLGPETALAPMPGWMVIHEPDPEPERDSELHPVRQPISRYGEKCLDAAVARILRAVAGEQRDVLSRETCSIARLVAGGVIPPAIALESRQWAARQMPTHDQRRPSRANDLTKAVHSAFLDGLQHPRRPNDGRA